MNRLSSLLLHLQSLAAAPSHLAAVLALGLLASACGPGTGGSGGGPIAGTYVTSDMIATSVSSTASLGGIDNVVASFGATAIQIEGACWAFNYQGHWAETDGEVRVTGFYRLAPTGTDVASATAIPATLVARTEPNGLRLTLLDARGTTITVLEPAKPVSDGVTPSPPPACITIAPM